MSYAIISPSSSWVNSADRHITPVLAGRSKWSAEIQTPRSQPLVKLDDKLTKLLVTMLRQSLSSPLCNDGSFGRSVGWSLSAGELHRFPGTASKTGCSGPDRWPFCGHPHFCPLGKQLNRRRIGVPCAGTLTRVSGLEHHADLDPQGWDQSNVPYNPKPLAILIRAHVSGTALNLLAIHICCVMMNPNSSHLEPDGMIKLLASIIH